MATQITSCATLAIAAGANDEADPGAHGASTVRLTLDRYGHLREGSHEQVADRLEALYRDAATGNT